MRGHAAPGRSSGAFRSCDVATNPGGGVIVSDYHKSRLEIFSPEGESQGAFVAGSDIDSDFDDRASSLCAKRSVALLGDEHNTAWVISEELELLVCMRLGDVGGQKTPRRPTISLLRLRKSP